MELHEQAKKIRQPSQDIPELFYTRWSPRAMTGEEITKEELLPLFEAARWAPSSRNEQPWRFIVAIKKEDKVKFMTFLTEKNQLWCKNAAALVLIISNKFFDYKHKENITHSFDSGSAWMSLALEGARRGYVVHGMAGFDYEKAREELKIPKDYNVEAMFAVGKLADPSVLPEDLSKVEVPNLRKEIDEIVSWDCFKWN